MRTIALAAPSLAALCLATLALAGCGSASTTSTAAPPQTTSTPVATATATKTVIAPTSTATVQSLGLSGTPACVAADLRLTYLGGQGATGHGLLGFALRNRSAHRCKTFGFPGVLFLGASNAPLPTHSVRTTDDFFGPVPEIHLVLAPGQQASFRLGVTHGAASTAGCTTAHGLQVIPPDDTAMLRVRLGPGAYECGSATVSPLRPGTSAFP